MSFLLYLLYIGYIAIYYWLLLSWITEFPNVNDTVRSLRKLEGQEGSVINGDNRLGYSLVRVSENLQGPSESSYQTPPLALQLCCAFEFHYTVVRQYRGRYNNIYIDKNITRTWPFIYYDLWCCDFNDNNQQI